MGSFAEAMSEYRIQLEKGVIQQAYKGLMDYMMDLRAYLKNEYPDYFVPGSIYYGYMDMTYFSFTPAALQERKLKIAIVFLHEAFRFEAWLAGANKQVQAQYWRAFKELGWQKHRLVATTKGADGIVETVLVENPDFGDMEVLTGRIEMEALNFIGDIVSFCEAHHI